MRILMIGLSHRTADLELREAVSLTGERLDRVYARLAASHPAAEAVAVSTCNRTELYVARPTHEAPGGEALREMLAEAVGVPVERLAAATVQREQEQAAAHLFRVTCGADSLVIGEPEVLGQVKRAYADANERGLVGPVLHKLFQEAIAAAKKVRQDTGIDRGRVSVASVAVEFAKGVFEGFAEKTVLAIGGGEVTKAMVRRLLEENARRVLMVNRTAERAQQLATTLGLTGDRGGARPWDDLERLLVESDIVLTGTASSEPILSESMLRRVVKKRRRRPLVLLDVAVPRDVDPAVGSLSNVFLYNLDDLQTVVEQTMSERGDQLASCEAMALEAATACMAEVQHRDVGQLVRELRRRLHDIGNEERARTRRKAQRLAPHDDDALEELVNEHTHRLINKILHLPLSQLDARDDSRPLGFYAAALRRLFDLDSPRPPRPEQTPDEETREDETLSARITR
ncbi:MAG: glutamyl-tRNA reductase [Phycisphaeraceae bacterium]